MPAGELDWTCRRTLDHLVDVMVSYAAHLASRATGRLPLARDNDPGAAIGDPLTRATAAVLSGVARAAPPGARGFHPSGMADAAGVVAMGATELVVHTGDVTVQTRGCGTCYSMIRDGGALIATHRPSLVGYPFGSSHPQD